MVRKRNSSRISEGRGDPSLNAQREKFVQGSLRRRSILECFEFEICRNKKNKCFVSVFERVRNESDMSIVEHHHDS